MTDVGGTMPMGQVNSGCAKCAEIMPVRLCKYLMQSRIAAFALHRGRPMRLGAAEHVPCSLSESPHATLAWPQAYHQFSSTPEHCSFHRGLASRGQSMNDQESRTFQLHNSITGRMCSVE